MADHPSFALADHTATNNRVQPPVGARNRNLANYFQPRRRTVPAPSRKLSWVGRRSLFLIAQARSCFLTSVITASKTHRSSRLLPAGSSADTAIWTNHAF